MSDRPIEEDVIFIPVQLDLAGLHPTGETHQIPILAFRRDRYGKMTAITLEDDAGHEGRWILAPGGRVTDGRTSYRTLEDGLAAMRAAHEGDKPDPEGGGPQKVVKLHASALRGEARSVDKGDETRTRVLICSLAA